MEHKQSKYNRMLANKIEESFKQWKERKIIKENEIYRFLHTIKGTAGSIGNTKIARIAEEKLSTLEEHSETAWEVTKWEEFLLDINFTSGNELNVAFTEENIPSDIEQNLAEDMLILVIDKDTHFISDIKEYLEHKGFHVLAALSFKKGLEQFYSFRPRLILLDEDSFSTSQRHQIEQIIAVSRKKFIPIAILTKHGSIDKRASAFQMGATDYITKPLNKDVLLPYLRNRIKFQQDIHSSISTDELTGAMNQKYMNLQIHEAIKSYQRYNRNFSIAMMDIDHFKQVNDTYGHLVGDEVLKEFVNILQQTKRETYTLYRYGGEEFLLFMPDTKDNDAKQALERIRLRFQSKEFNHLEQDFHVTFSAGIAQISSHEETVNDLKSRADKALYHSKNSGRNRVSLYRDDFANKAIKKLQLIVVDDDKIIRSVLERSIQQLDFPSSVEPVISTYENGDHFLKSSWYNPSDKYFILLDGVMPKMDGIEVLSTLRSSYPDKDMVISMLSARSGEANIVHALNKGADDYMLKPFNISEVKARIIRLVQRLLLS